MVHQANGQFSIGNIGFGTLAVSVPILRPKPAPKTMPLMPEIELAVGIDKAREGITTLEEVLRITSEDH